MILFSLFLVNILSTLDAHLGVNCVYNQIHTKRINQGEQYPCANGLCTCTTSNADCYEQGKKLHYIPKLPNSITTLSFRSNYLPIINATTFNNISNLKIEALVLLNNQVTTIAGNAFEYLTVLKSLWLSDPGLRATEVGNALSSIKKETITIICLEQQSWKSLPGDLFLNLFDTKLETLLLSTQIQEIDTLMFTGLKYLKMLNLEQSKLTSFVIRKLELSGLETLELNNNRMSTVPNFCYAFNRSCIPKVEKLDLSNNIIFELREGDFKCLKRLTELVIGGNPVNILGDNFMSSLSALQILYLNGISKGVVTKIDNYAFNSSTLKMLWFKENDLTRRYTYTPEYLFASLPNLFHLILIGTKLPNYNPYIVPMFSPLSRIRSLRLGSTGLDYIPEIISNLTSLRFLDVSKNKIQSWNGTKIFGKSKLGMLLLYDNQISVINDTSFPDSLLKNIQKKSLDLAGNPFSCTCQTVESINWMRRHVHILGTYPKDYKCFSPSEVNGLSIMDYNPSPESCAEKNIVLLVSIPVSVVTVTVVIAIYLTYRCRWRLRYGIYLFNNRNNSYERIEGHDDFVYAGFVIYSDDDRTWVHNDLINRMEDQEGFRLCIRLRDFDVGKVHVDNIVENMFLSEKIIVVLSNNFAKDDWCHFQLLLAETRLLKQNIDMLVIFMLDEIHSDCLRASLYKLVTEKQYALWSNDETGHNLFWEQAISQMRRPTAIN